MTDAATLRYLTAIMRRRYGTDSPAWQFCVNLGQSFAALEVTTDDRRANIEKNIRRQWADLIELAGLTPSLPVYAR